jgi:hypothetical protein
MSRNKFGELVRKYIVSDVRRFSEVFNYFKKDNEKPNIYQTLNNMLNILYEKDDMGVEEVVDKVCRVTGLKKGQAKEIVLAHKKYKPKAIKWAHMLPGNAEKYKQFRDVVIVECETNSMFRACFVGNDYDEAVRDMDVKIIGIHNKFTLLSDLDMTNETIKELENYINGQTGGSIYHEAVVGFVLNHPLFRTQKKVRFKKMTDNKKTPVAKKKTRGHDKYRFFINKPGTEGVDTARVLKEAEDEGYDLVEMKNTKSNGSFIYARSRLWNILSKVPGVHPSFESNVNGNWFFVDTKLTITEIYEGIKEAEANRTKIVVERYRVSSKG